MKRQDGTSSQRAHMAHHLGNPKPVKQGKKKSIENGQGSRGDALANLTGILLQGHIAALVGAIFDGPMGPH